MVKSEREIKQMTKQQLKQWLTSHDQRLPSEERLKKYYFDRAMSYLKILQKEQSGMIDKKPSRSKIKIKGQVISNSRTKKKLRGSASLTPKSSKKPIVRTQRRRRNSSFIGESPSAKNTSPARSRSKRKKIVIKRKTPTKQSPVLTNSIKKKRARVRRATFDHSKLNDALNNNDDDESSSSEETESDQELINNENSNRNQDNIIKKKFVLDKDPSKMTISALQAWLRKNSIPFSMHLRKAEYVELVSEYGLSPLSKLKKRELSPQHKYKYSPQPKKTKISKRKYSSPAPIRRSNDDDGPLPRNLCKSPLTPNDDEKSSSRRIVSKIRGIAASKREGELITPALNKTGVTRINTPSKNAMRDEIRSLLWSDTEEDAPYGITATGKPTNYDANELKNVLNDLKKNNVDSPRIKVYDSRKSMNYDDDDSDDHIIEDMKHTKADDDKQDVVHNNSIISSVLASFSPPRITSPNTIKNMLGGLFTGSTTKKQSKANRIKVPSPCTPHNNNNQRDQEQEQEAVNMGSMRNENENLISPVHNYRQKLNLNSSRQQINKYQDDEPMSPAIGVSTNNNNHPMPPSNMIQRQNAYNQYQPDAVRRSQRLATKNNKKKASPPKKPSSSSSSSRPQIMDSPGINPSIPSNLKNFKKNQSPKMKFAYEQKKRLNKLPQTTNRCKFVGSLLFIASLIAGLAVFFSVFDGMTTVNILINQLSDILIGEEEIILFCDKGSRIVTGLEDVECRSCPDHASNCHNGQVYCETNYIFQDNKCVKNRALVRFAYDIYEQVIDILSRRKGRFECGESMTTPEMTEDELMSRIEILDKKMLAKSFNYFKTEIVPESGVIATSNDNKRYYSHKTIKSPLCTMKEFAITHIVFIIATCSVIFVVFGIIYRYKRNKQNEILVDNLIGEVYKILEERYAFGEQQHAAVDFVKNRIKPKNQKIWNEVDKKIQKDSNIQKSMRMIDGMQKKCWRLSTNSVGNNDNNQNNKNDLHNPYIQQWSPSRSFGQAQQQQQQQWNNNNNKENVGDIYNSNSNVPNFHYPSTANNQQPKAIGMNNGGFNFYSSNQMQQRDESEEPKFPAYSKPFDKRY